MVNRAITNLTEKASPNEAWLSLVSTQDTVGLKVYSAPGPNSGTRPAVVEAVVEGLLAAGLPPKQIIIWDRQSTDLRLAGFFDLGRARAMRLAGRQQRLRWLDALRPLRLVMIAGAALAVGAVPLPALAVELSAPVAALYSTVSIYPPSAKSMTVCYGFVCRRREILEFTPADRSAPSQILSRGHASAAAERAAVQKAAIWFDRRMGPVIGTNKRVAKADFRYFDDKHNFDCWDTTRNTASLPLVLQQWGLLKYHVVGDPHYRGNALVLQAPHNTAVLVERATRIAWVVDMWPRGYLQPPDVMTVEK